MSESPQAGLSSAAPDSTSLVALIRAGNFPDFVLPKGGVEAGESLEQMARREIEEEAGLRSLSLSANWADRNIKL